MALIKIENIMEKFIDNNVRAIIIAIENYRFKKISNVKYALNDAEAFKTLLIDNLKVSPENIKTYYDKYASKTGLEDEIKYEIRNLKEEEKFIFYYVGHGFYNGTNRLTAWDTSLTNIPETTFSLIEILIDPLKESNCKKSLVFLDSCSSYVTDKLSSREALSNLDEKELDYLLHQSNYCATFLSCSPGEKSYSDDNLQQGIWTYHLIKALKGDEKSILTNNKYITDSSLRDYLMRSVSSFIANKTDIKNTQTPYAKISTSNSFIIHEIFIEENKEHNEELPIIDIIFNNLTLINVEFKDVKSASGFKSGHWAPDKISQASEYFIRKAFEQEISNEIQRIYQKSKDILHLKRHEFKKEIEIEGATIENKYYKFDITLTQYHIKPSFGQFLRELVIFDLDELTYDFDDIFSVSLNKLIFDCNISKADFENFVTKFENLAEKTKGKLIDDDKNMILNFNTIEGLDVYISFNKKKLIVSTKREYRIKDFLEKVESFINNISKDKIEFNKK